MEELIKDTIIETKTESKKSTSTKESVKDKEIEELKGQVASLTSLITQLLSGQANNNTSVRDDVTLVYMSESLGYIEAGNVKLNCTKFKESFTLSRYDFDAIVGKYRKWFEDGILAVSARDYKIAQDKGLKTENEYFLTKDIMESIPVCTAAELEEIWHKANTKEQKYSICEYYKAHLIEGDTRFNNREKVELLNRLTNGGFRREVKEVSGYDLLIQPTEMN